MEGLDRMRRRWRARRSPGGGRGGWLASLALGAALAALLSLIHISEPTRH